MADPAQNDFGAVAIPEPTPAPAQNEFGAVAIPEDKDLTFGQKLGIALDMPGSIYGNRVIPSIAGAAMQAGGSVVGGSIGALTSPISGPVGPVAGAMSGAGIGNMAKQSLDNWLGYQKGYKPEDAVAATITGAPGESLVGASGGKVVKEVAKAAGLNAVATEAQTGIGQGRWATPGEMELATALGMAAPMMGRLADTGKNIAKVAENAAPQSAEDTLAQEGRAIGYVSPPAETNPSVAQTTIGGWGERAAMRFKATAINQKVTNALAGAELGLPKGQPITDKALQVAEEAAMYPYQRITEAASDATEQLQNLRAANETVSGAHDLAVIQSDPDYAAKVKALTTVSQGDLQALKIARNQAKGLWAKYNSYTPLGGAGGDPEIRDQALAATARASDLEDKVGAAAQAIGSPQLLAQYQAARKQLAQIQAVRSVTDPYTGEVSARGLKTLDDNGVPLTGNLKTIASMAGTKAFRQFMNDASKTPVAGVAALNALTMLGAGAGAAVAHGEGNLGRAATGAATAAAIPVSKAITRAALLSPPVQRGFLSNMVKPYYGSPSPDFLAQLLRQGTMASGQPQNIPPFLQPQP